MDTPIGDIAAQGYYAVSQAARAKGVPVLLSGMGGDEMFWGYEWVREAVARNHSGAGFKSWPSWFRKLLGGSPPKRPTFYEVHDELRLGDLWSRQIFTPQALERVPDAFWLDCASIDRGARIDIAISALLIRTWLRSNCLALVDRVSMAHSVEMRLPLLDVKSIDILTGLRNAGLEDWKKPHKWLLIKACEDVLPPEVLRRRKQGFTPPVLIWLSKITTTYRSLLNNGALVRRGILNSSKIASMTNVSGTFLYKLIILEVWTRLVIEGSSVWDIFSEVSGPENLRTEDRFS
jgi:asparagine synthase (glutamine-hydrolysing)